jgi:hypothetical protein
VQAERPANFADSFETNSCFVEQRDAPPTVGAARYFQVDDVDLLHEQRVVRGVVFAHPPQKVCWRYGPELVETDGYRVRLWDERTMREKA